MDLNFIVQDYPDCTLIFDVFTRITVSISAFDGEYKDQKKYSGLDVSSNGSLEVDVPLNGDFTIEVEIILGCQTCCNECVIGQNGEPKFVGSQDQSNTNELGVNVRVRFESCNCCEWE